MESRKTLEKELIASLQREQELRTHLNYLKKNFDDAVQRAVKEQLKRSR